MTGTDTPRPHPHVPFLYEMAISFFEVAKETLDPVLQAIDGYREPSTDQNGRTAPPDHVARKLQELAPNEMFVYAGACLSATTNLGLAYVHSFRLLSFLTQNKDVLPPDASKPHLAKLFDALPADSQRALNEIDGQATSHDLELEIATEPPPEEADETQMSKGRDFRSTLADWQAKKMLHESHLFGLGRGSAMRIFVPLRSLLILDQIIADQIAPKLSRKYETIAQRMSNHAKGPELRWDEGMIHVSLPKRMGRTLEAKWKPGVTSVVRIRESGTAAWTPGFETPFNKCSFVDLKPDTEYEVQLTHKNEAGESKPTVVSTTKPPSEH